MTATDYSQTGEQEAIQGALASLGIEQGRFLDIGAGDGETFSNTRALALAGWGGVAVEPAAWAFDRLVELYADSFVSPVCAVVTPDRAGIVPFAYSKDDHVSSISDKHIDLWKTRVPYRRVWAAAVPMRLLLDAFDGGFEVASIDAEGLTVALLDAYRRHDAFESLRVLCIEHEQRDPMLGRPWRLVTHTPNNAVYAR